MIMKNADQINRLVLELKANRVSESESDSSQSQDSDNKGGRKSNRIVLAIIGSRDMNNQNLFDEKMENWVKKYGQPDEIVSGGAKGADTLGEEYAEKYGIPIEIFRPDYKRYPGKYAPLVRNTDIIQYCTHVMAFPSRNGRGTQDAMRKANKFHKKMKVIYID